jgi:hypothetical protein
MKSDADTGGLMRLRRLSKAEYAAAVSLTPLMSKQAHDIGRAVLVDERPQSEVARQYDVTRQRVNYIVSSITRAYTEAQPESDAFVRVELMLPQRLAADVSKLARALASRNRRTVTEHAQGEVGAAIARVLGDLKAR